MDIEQLSKSQIVLLTLLISFVTSIATGIVTVSLMDQAPPIVAQTVNRVIERTVQQVAPSGQPAAAVITQEKTVIVKESELISQAVSRAVPSLVRLYTSDAESPSFLGLGIVIDASGTIATDGKIMADSDGAVAQLSNSSRVRVSVMSRDRESGVAYLASATTTPDGKSPEWTPASISTTRPVLGQTVVSLSGKSATRIGDGIITAVTPSATSTPGVIETSISSDSIMPGSPIITTEGSLAGLSTSVSRGSSASGFVDASALMNQSQNTASGTESSGQ
ncbi:MAG: trypsin-like peptidase domain-containing protein [Patescibacteria group bacterium]|nr:trypsin-like peptidase domain-containing protein [bacterium]MDZ4227611.1 trypsin-like peptidase domain-containing protein [Patescibacteria group bacterium]